MHEPPAAEDPLPTLRKHVRSAQQAAERLARQAQASPGGDPRAQTPADPPRPPNGGTPPSGWHAPSRAAASGELRALVELLESLRGLLPAELREQVNDLVRQVLLLLRAIIDWLVARLEREGPRPRVEVEDIPIS